MKLSPAEGVSIGFLWVIFFARSIARGNIIPRNETVPAVILFGDSIVDAGNNNKLVTLIKSDFLPYGINFQGGVPTGRFSDGKIISDFAAESLGVKKLVPAYLDPNLSPQDLLTGVTFASAGSGFDPLTAKLVSALSMRDQLKYFAEYKERMTEMVGAEGMDQILRNSVTLIVAGSDDIVNTYFRLHARPEYDVASYTDFIAKQAADFVREVYLIGARRIGVSGLPPVGCIPSQRTPRDCAEEYNDAARLLNSKLSQALHFLSNILSGSKIVFMDVYHTVRDIIENPTKYGFEVVDKGCCGTGELEVAVLCNRLTSSVCPNVSAHLFWDSYHLTQKANSITLAIYADEYFHKFF